MTRQDTHAELDSLAEQFVREQDAARAEQLLGQLLFDYCAPLIRAIASAKLRGSANMTQDVEDVCGDALLELVGKVADVRSGAAKTIESFSRYTAVVTYHACHDYFRRKFPERHRLKNRLRYILKPERGLDIWESTRGDWICGLRQWREAQTPAVSMLSVPPEGAARMTPPGLLAAIFQSASGPLEFDALVDLVAELWGIKDRPAGLRLVESLPAPESAAADTSLCQRLGEMWNEIGALPRAQRVALLLHLRAEDHKCALELFPLTGVASIREIAGRLEIEAEELAELWSRLPLDDLSIAERLQVTRQQVINLRKSARKRLERRMAVIKRGESASFVMKILVCLCRI